MGQRLELIALENFPLVQPGDDLGQLLIEALASNDLVLQAGDLAEPIKLSKGKKKHALVQLG